MTRLTAKQVVTAIGDEHLSLVPGRGYWYFIYDTLEATDLPRRFDTHSVYTMRLSNLPLDSWVTEGREFVARMTGGA